MQRRYNFSASLSNLPIYQSIYICVYAFESLSVCLSVCVCLCLYLSVCAYHSHYMSVCPSVLVCLNICICVCFIPSVCMSVCLSLPREPMQVYRCVTHLVPVLYYACQNITLYQIHRRASWWQIGVIS